MRVRISLDPPNSGVLAEVACLAHNQEVVGANPTSATKFKKNEKKLKKQLDFLKSCAILSNVKGNENFRCCL